MVQNCTSRDRTLRKRGLEIASARPVLALPLHAPSHCLGMSQERLGTGSQFILIETRPYLIAALEKFKKQPQAVSFTDCIVMTVADDYGTKDIFGFDRQFEDAGYRRLEPASK